MVNGNDLLEHIEKCDHCIMIEELKERTVARVVKGLDEYVVEQQLECFNNAGRD